MSTVLPIGDSELIVNGGSSPFLVSTCGCLDLIDIALASQNGQLGRRNTPRGEAAIVFVRRCDDMAGPAPVLLARFCPMCGEAYR